MLLASISEAIVNEIAHFISQAGLPGIFALMVVSSMCIPIPAEVVLLFGGFVVADPGAAHAAHEITLVGLVLAGLAGTVVGSWVAYGVGRGGRLELFERHGDRFHMGPAQLEKADRWFHRRGELAVLYGRVIPVVRAFISLPAGLARMDFWRFTLYTLIGSVPFVLGLALLGEALGSEWHQARKVFEYVDYLVLIAIVVGVAFLIMRRRRAGQRDTLDAQP
jgi:membrane protein DedA with SNARE-associated domain